MQDTVRIMVDLETLSTRHNAAIVAIGAVVVGEPDKRFYCTVTPHSAELAGLHISGSTVAWWMEQSDLARQRTFRPDVAALALGRALDDFSQFLLKARDGQDLEIWGNGATFDNVILRSAYTALGTEAPWAFYHDRCYRTMKALYPQVPAVRPEVAHCALDDALAQAEHLHRILLSIQ